MAIAIDVVVVVIPIGAAATTDAVLSAALRARCCHCRVRGSIGGAVVDNNAVAVDAPAAPPIPLSGATDPMAAATTKTCDGTGYAAATVTAAATEEEEYRRRRPPATAG
jgi:hypothetical protein